MELRHIRYFLALAEELHFRRAAEKLFIAQPALSRQIKEMEQYLGVTLFKRDKRNVALTAAGKYLQQEGYQLLKHADVIKTSVKDFGTTMQGSIRIGCIGSAMTSIVPEYVRQLEIDLPNVRTQIVENTTQHLLNLLQDGQIDLMFGRPHRKIAHIQSENLFTDSTLLVTAKNNQWKLNQSSDIAMMKDLPFIIFPRHAGSYFRDQLELTCSKHGFLPNIKHETINIYAILKLVEKDVGISVLPKSIIDVYPLELEYFTSKEFNIPLEMNVSYRHEPDNELMAKVLELLRSVKSKI